MGRGRRAGADHVTPRLVVLASGAGTNCQALLDACDHGRLHAQVTAVVTDRDQAGVRGRARRHGVPDVHVSLVGLSCSGVADRLIEAIEPFEPTLLVLAGWMRLLSTAFCRRFPIVNLHPALPGELPGMNAIERAYGQWTAGTRQRSGVMVHWVPDSGIDDGSVVATRVVGFEVNDTLSMFEARMHAVEHDLIVSAVSDALAQLEVRAS